MPANPAMEKLLRSMKKLGASDLHIKVGLPPIFRVDSDLRLPQGLEPLAAEQTDTMLRSIMPETLRERFDAQGDLDFSHFLVMENGAPQSAVQSQARERFRCNVFRAGGGLHAAIRRVKPEIPTFESLHLPPIYQKIVETVYEGLVLVAGVTGSGKSTTLACMIEWINANRAVNIITVEDPVEFHFNPRLSIVSQREVGVDVPDFDAALKHIVRQDPDVIFIGELRDRTTMRAALQAAETGHLVFGSLHSADVVQTFARIMEFFPSHEHDFVRGTLANTVRAICAQRLLPATEESGAGMVPATEVMTINSSIREMIRQSEETKIATVIHSSERGGMRSFNTSLAQLVDEGFVTLSQALEYAPNRETLSSQLKGVQVKATTITGGLRG